MIPALACIGQTRRERKSGALLNETNARGRGGRRPQLDFCGWVGGRTPKNSQYFSCRSFSSRRGGGCWQNTTLGREG